MEVWITCIFLLMPIIFFFFQFIALQLTNVHPNWSLSWNVPPWSLPWCWPFPWAHFRPQSWTRPLSRLCPQHDGPKPRTSQRTSQHAEPGVRRLFSGGHASDAQGRQITEASLKIHFWIVIRRKYILALFIFRRSAHGRNAREGHGRGNALWADQRCWHEIPA